MRIGVSNGSLEAKGYTYYICCLSRVLTARWTDYRTATRTVLIRAVARSVLARMIPARVDTQVPAEPD